MSEVDNGEMKEMKIYPIVQTVDTFRELIMASFVFEWGTIDVLKRERNEILSIQHLRFK